MRPGPGRLLRPPAYRYSNMGKLADLPLLWYATDKQEYLSVVSSAVSQYKDLSGKGNDSVVQSTSNQRPAWSSATLNGLNGASFDGSNDKIAVAANSSINDVWVGGATIFIVPARVTATNRLWDKTTSGTAGHLLALTGLSGGFYNFSFEIGTTGNTAKFGSSTAVIPTGGAVISISYNSDNLNTQPVARSNGTALTITTTQSGTGTVVSDAASDWYIGNRSDGARAYGGDINEIILFDRVLTAAETLIVEIYLANKWALYHPNAAWFAAYTDLVDRAIIQAYGVNKDNFGTNTTFNPVAARWNPSASALGAITSLPDVGRAVNTATEATNPPVNTASGIGTERALLYNGTTTVLNAGSDTSIDDIFAAGGCVIGAMKPTTAGQSASITVGGRIFEKTGLKLNLYDPSGGACRLNFTQNFSVTNGDWGTTNRDVVLGGISIFAVTYNSANVANNPSIYINSLTSKALTQLLTPTLTPTSDAANNMYLGNRSALDRTFDGYIGELAFLKSIPTTAQRSILLTGYAGKYGVTLT